MSITIKNLGFSLIEVLIAIVLFATGILGIAGLQMKSLKMLSHSDSINAAMISASDMAGRMRMNNVGLKNDAYNDISLPTATKPSCIECDEAEQALLESYEVYERLQTSLPSPTLSITNSGNDIYTIQITWEERMDVLMETKSHRLSFRI